MKTFTSDLKQALTSACLIAPKSASQPLLSMVKLNVHEDKLVLSSTNFDEQYQESIPGYGTKLDCLIPAHKLLAVVKKLKSKEIDLEHVDGYLHITADKLKTKIPANPVESFPAIDFPSIPFNFFMTFKELKTIHDRTLIFIGDNPAKKSLTGLHVKMENNRAVFTATDAYRIGRQIKRDVNPHEYSIHNCDFILPKKSLQNISKIFKHSDNLMICSSPQGDKFQMSTDLIEYQSKCIEAEYPNLNSLFAPASYTTSVNVEDLLNGLDMLYELANKETNAICKATFTADELTLENQQLDSSVSLYCVYDGVDIPGIGMNVNFLNQIVKVFKTCHLLNIRVTKPETPILIDSNDFENFQTVLMPVRIQW